MLLLIDQESVRDCANLIDGICKLQAAILDVNAGAAVRQITAIDIRDAAGRRAAVPALSCHALKPCSRPVGPTPSDLSLRCKAERSFPIKAAVREMLPPKRLICAMR